MTACIVGWSHTPFGKHDGKDVEALIVEVAEAAVADAGLGAADIDEIVLGHYGGGFSPQGFTSSLVLQADEGWRFKPATRVENACATGSAAIHQGLKSVDARRARFVLVVGVEKMTDLPGPEIAKALLTAAYLKEESAIEGGFAGVFGQIAQRYFQQHGDQSDALAAIAAKNHKNGCANPMAQMRKDLGFEFCRQVSEKNPLVAGPLKRTDCSLVSDGAAALVLTDVETALGMEKAVVFRSAVQVNDFLPMSRRDITLFEGCAEAWQRARAEARLDPRRPRLRRDPRLLHDRGTARVRGDGPDGARPGGARGARGLDAEGRPAAGQSIGRSQGQGPPDRGDRRLDARALGDAADRHGGRDADRGSAAWRRLQHGRRRGRQLRLDPRAAPLGDVLAAGLLPRRWQARAGVAAVFFLNGFGFGSWVPRIAEIQAGLP